MRILLIIIIGWIAASFIISCLTGMWLRRLQQYYPPAEDSTRKRQDAA